MWIARWRYCHGITKQIRATIDIELRKTFLQSYLQLHWICVDFSRLEQAPVALVFGYVLRRRHQ